MAKLNPFRFSTKYQDDETDLLYYGYRYLSTSTGRWLSRDPIGENGGRNLFAMVMNDPCDYIDILGLEEARKWTIPDNLKTCCDSRTVAAGEQKLREIYAKAARELKQKGAKATQPGDHQVIICRSYPKDGSSKEIMFDWWGDDFGLNYGGDPSKFRNDYPVLVENPPNPNYTDCDDQPWPKNKKGPKPGWSATGL